MTVDESSGSVNVTVAIVAGRLATDIVVTVSAIGELAGTYIYCCYCSSHVYCGLLYFLSISCCSLYVLVLCLTLVSTVLCAC